MFTDKILIVVDCSYNRKECPRTEEIVEPKVGATRQQSGTPSPAVTRSKEVSTRESQHSAMASIMNGEHVSVNDVSK